MTTDQTRKKSVEKNKPAKPEAGDLSDNNCRCKEVSKKSTFEMLRLMISDLAFWKKAK